MENVVKQRLREILEKYGSNPTQLAKMYNLNQKTVHNQINSTTQLSASIILLILETYPDISAEWLMRGRGEMILSDDAEISTSSDNISEDDIRLLRERIISLEAENKVLREIAGLHQGERSHEGKIA